MVILAWLSFAWTIKLLKDNENLIHWEFSRFLPIIIVVILYLRRWLFLFWSFLGSLNFKQCELKNNGKCTCSNSHKLWTWIEGLSSLPPCQNLRSGLLFFLLSHHSYFIYLFINKNNHCFSIHSLESQAVRTAHFYRWMKIKSVLLNAQPPILMGKSLSYLFTTKP
jgi:hypothetical protein